MTMSNTVLRKIGWSILFLFATLMLLIAGRYLALNPENYFPQQKAVYMAHTAGLLLHIIGAMLTIILGPFQFIARIRNGRFVPIHRWMGRIYLLGVLFGGIGGLYMASIAYSGWLARIGFTLLALAWLLSGFMAYKHIRNKAIEHHRQWMIRNYALTFAAVTLRLGMIVAAVAGVELTTAYIIMAWLSWIPNLIAAEWLFNRVQFQEKIDLLPVRQPEQ